MWESLTQPQATLLAGVFTMLAAIAGVLLAWLLFSSRVKDLKSALEESGKLLIDHREKVSTTLNEIQSRLGELDIQSQIATQSLHRIEETVEDLENAAVYENVPEDQIVLRERMRSRWVDMRAIIERIAEDEVLDGRRRAKYARRDRRNYAALVEEMASDGVLGEQAGALRMAAEIWQRYRNGRRTPSADDDNRMAELHHELIGDRGR